MTAPDFQPTRLRHPRWPAAALAFAVAVATLTTAAPQLHAQSRDVQPLINTVDRLERQLQALERTVYRGSPPPAGALSGPAGGDVPPAAMSQLQFKTTQLEEQMRGQTGQIEELGFKVDQLSSRLDRLVADVDFRLRTLEEANGVSAPSPSALGGPVSAQPPTVPSNVTPFATTAGTPGPGGGAPRSLGTLTGEQLRQAGVQAPSNAGEPAPTQQAAVPPAPAATGNALPPGSPEDQYDYARAFLMRRDFTGAEQALRAFVDTYPESELAGNAQYWLGETYYVRNDFGAAARTFADGFQRYPGSSKAPDNLLKLGMSLAALERTEDACITFDKLSSEYPEAAASIKRLAQQESARLKCR